MRRTKGFAPNDGLVSLRCRTRKSNSAVQPGRNVFSREGHPSKLYSGSRMVSENRRGGICAGSTDPCMHVFPGTGVPQDYKLAAHWLQLAAHNGDPRAQMDLGYLYEQGKGVPLDYVTAYMWYGTAGSGGDKRAAKRLRILSKVMTKEQISGSAVPRHQSESCPP